MFIIRDTIKNSGFSKQISNLQHRAMSSRRRVNQSTSASWPRSRHSRKHRRRQKQKEDIGSWANVALHFFLLYPQFCFFYPSSPRVVRRPFVGRDDVNFAVLSPALTWSRRRRIAELGRSRAGFEGLSPPVSTPDYWARSFEGQTSEMFPAASHFSIPTAAMFLKLYF